MQKKENSIIRSFAADEKYRVVQDKIYQSDFDRMMLEEACEGGEADE
jgi:hypothetical protein